MSEKYGQHPWNCTPEQQNARHEWMMDALRRRQEGLPQKAFWEQYQETEMADVKVVAVTEEELQEMRER